MELRSLIWKVLKEQVDQNTIVLKNKYVGEGKPISEKDFNNLIEVTGNKFYLLSWLTKKVGMGIIKPEDIYKYKEYFDIYEKNKRKFEHKDIHFYKTAEDVAKFLNEVIRIREGNLVYDEIAGKDNYVSQKDIEKLENSGGVKYLGMFDNKNFKYQVFQVHGIGEDVWELYRDILGRCKGRARGAKIDICTVGNYDYFKQYLQDYGDSTSYFVLFNLDDSKSPYQLHYESGQFMDKNDKSDHGINQFKFFEFVGDKVPKYSFENEDRPINILLPVRGKGGIHSNGKKYGTWRRNGSDGKPLEIITFKNGIPMGPFIDYYDNGQIDKKGNLLGDYGTYYGDYEEFFYDGSVYRKGKYSNKGEKIGIWHYGTESGNYRLIDFDKSPASLSAFTEDDVLIYTLSPRKGSLIAGPRVKYYETGEVRAKGNMTENSYPTGVWVFYKKNGTLKAKGRYVKGYMRQGQWMDLVKSKNGKRVYFEMEFEKGYPKHDSVNVYDLKGKFIKTITRKEAKYPYHKGFAYLYDYGRDI